MKLRERSYSASPSNAPQWLLTDKDQGVAAAGEGERLRVGDPVIVVHWSALFRAYGIE